MRVHSDEEAQIQESSGSNEDKIEFDYEKKCPKHPHMPIVKQN